MYMLFVIFSHYLMFVMREKKWVNFATRNDCAMFGHCQYLWTWLSAKSKNWTFKIKKSCRPTSRSLWCRHLSIIHVQNAISVPLLADYRCRLKPTLSPLDYDCLVISLCCPPGQDSLLVLSVEQCSLSEAAAQSLKGRIFRCPNESTIDCSYVHGLWNWPFRISGASRLYF